MKRAAAALRSFVPVGREARAAGSVSPTLPTQTVAASEEERTIMLRRIQQARIDNLR